MTPNPEPIVLDDAHTHATEHADNDEGDTISLDYDEDLYMGPV
jgi:hypothetical protein